MRAWFGLADGRDADPLSLLLAVDALPPTAFELGLSGLGPDGRADRARPLPSGARVRCGSRSPPATSPAASWRRTPRSGTARTGWWRSRGSWRGSGSDLSHTGLLHTGLLHCRTAKGRVRQLRTRPFAMPAGAALRGGSVSPASAGGRWLISRIRRRRQPERPAPRSSGPRLQERARRSSASGRRTGPRASAGRRRSSRPTRAARRVRSLTSSVNRRVARAIASRTVWTPPCRSRAMKRTWAGYVAHVTGDQLDGAARCVRRCRRPRSTVAAIIGCRLPSASSTRATPRSAVERKCR